MASMYALCRKISVYLCKLPSKYFLSKTEKDAWIFFRSQFAKLSDQDSLSLNVLIQSVDDHSYFLKFMYLLLVLRKKGHRLNISWVSVRLKFRYRGDLKDYLKKMLIENVFTDRRWAKLFMAAGGRVAWRFDSVIATKGDWGYASSAVATLHSKRDLEKLFIENIHVGDLVYDTYLRFKPAPTVLIDDILLVEIIAKARALIRRISIELDSQKFDLIICSYASYLQHGLLVRVGLQKRVRVLTMGTFNQLITKPTEAFPFHRRHFHKYREWFAACPNYPEALSLGKKMLENRISGGGDSAIFYMKFSAFHNTTRGRIFSSGKRIVVMGHDFFDSPHIYGEMAFPDFYEWLVFIFEVARHSSAKVYFKPHPNSVVGNEEVVERLKSSYPHVTFLDKEISNKQILDEGVDLVLTVYGTVAHEFAYVGAKVACCGSSPHQEYNFCETVLNEERLKELVLYPERVRVSLVPADVEEFVFVHNYRLITKKLQLFPWTFEFDDSTSISDLHQWNGERLTLMKSEYDDIDVL